MGVLVHHDAVRIGRAVVAERYVVAFGTALEERAGNIVGAKTGKITFAAEHEYANRSVGGVVESDASFLKFLENAEAGFLTGVGVDFKWRRGDTRPGCRRKNNRNSTETEEYKAHH